MLLSATFRRQIQSRLHGITSGLCLALCGRCEAQWNAKTPKRLGRTVSPEIMTLKVQHLGTSTHSGASSSCMPNTGCLPPASLTSLTEERQASRSSRDRGHLPVTAVTLHRYFRLAMTDLGFDWRPAVCGVSKTVAAVRSCGE
jgi:hypothetical protein